MSKIICDGCGEKVPLEKTNPGYDENYNPLDGIRFCNECEYGNPD